MTLLAVAQSLAIALTISLVWVSVQVVEALAAQEVFEVDEAAQLPVS
ncbi:MAG: hypothetical protein OEM22_05620 [Acidimicrobiia bacterium]|nr:hypothetical protein [Acidimicrobiia bacterium]MDH3469898.1 hypothetical protein [Acidimicrobiia bacterium]